MGGLIADGAVDSFAQQAGLTQVTLVLRSSTLVT
jgi:hypothetical protein